MKRVFIAAALLAAAPLALAQSNDAAKPDAARAPEVPKMSCGNAPQLPGNTMMQDSGVRKRFETDVRTYTECIKAYSSAREAAIKANRDAANQAINDYNTWQASIMDEQKKRRGGDSTTGTVDTGTGAGDRVKTY
jgi:hypothetical protein